MSPKTSMGPLEGHAGRLPMRSAEALAFVLQSEQGLEVIAQAGSLAEARRALDGGGLGRRLDAALIDLLLPDGDGTDLYRGAASSDPLVQGGGAERGLVAGPARRRAAVGRGSTPCWTRRKSPRQIAREEGRT